MTSGASAVLVSTFNEERDIDRALDSILAQTVSSEVIVVDGGSIDGTVSRLKARAAADARITVHADGTRRSLPAALNLALSLTDKPYVAKVDARTFIAPDFLERALEVFAQEGGEVGCVGGRPDQFGETPFGDAVARARMSPFGVGGSGYADPRAHADVDTVQCGVYRRSMLLEAGGFDPALQFGEDEEVNWRLRQAGYRIVRDSRIRFGYLTRPSWTAAFLQYRNYGRARVAVSLKHPGFLRPHHLIPSLFVVAASAFGIAVPFSNRARRLLVLTVGGYAAGAVVAAGIAVGGVAPRRVARTAAAFTALHLGYGLGLLEGAWRSRQGLLDRVLRTPER